MSSLVVASTSLLKRAKSLQRKRTRPVPSHSVFGHPLHISQIVSLPAYLLLATIPLLGLASFMFASTYMAIANAVLACVHANNQDSDDSGSTYFVRFLLTGFTAMFLFAYLSQ
jgi:hypothetical protein